MCILFSKLCKLRASVALIFTALYNTVTIEIKYNSSRTIQWSELSIKIRPVAEDFCIPILSGYGFMIWFKVGLWANGLFSFFVLECGVALF